MAFVSPHWLVYYDKISHSWKIELRRSVRLHGIWNMIMWILDLLDKLFESKLHHSRTKTLEFQKLSKKVQKINILDKKKHDFEA